MKPEPATVVGHGLGHPVDLPAVAPRLCSLRDCQGEAAYEIFLGPDFFTTTHRVFACTFDRVEVMEIAARRFASVEWHDIGL